MVAVDCVDCGHHNLPWHVQNIQLVARADSAGEAQDSARTQTRFLDCR